VIMQCNSRDPVWRLVMLNVVICLTSMFAAVHTKRGGFVNLACIVVMFTICVPASAVLGWLEGNQFLKELRLKGVTSDTATTFIFSLLPLLPLLLLLGVLLKGR